MQSDFQVQVTGVGGTNWATLWRGAEAQAREMYRRQQHFYSVGRFRLLDASGAVVDECRATPLFLRPCAKA
jgi:hypothetical protein